MALTQNFNVNPYYDDYDETKGYSRILFRPGYAVQARELTQLQTMMQKQVERFGQHVFREGSMVLGGQTAYENENIFYIKIEDDDTNGNAVDVNSFVGKFIKKVGSDSVRAYVVAVAAKEGTDPKTLIVKYYTPQRFTNSDNIEDESSTYLATAKASLSVGLSSIISVSEGVFFINGFFTRVGAQTIILDKYGTKPTYRVGLEFADTIADENDDTSLLDPALEASNYQAPGATRLKLTLTLAKRSITSTDDSKFIDLTRIQNGIITQRNIYPQYSVLEDTLARRTFDESGDYTVRPFNVSFNDDVISNNGVGFANSYNIVISPGKAYVKGYEFETISPTSLVAPRARDFISESNYPLTINYQNYIDVTNIKGLIDLKELTTLNVHSVDANSINTVNSTVLSATKIGTIRIRALDYQYGANTTSASNAVFRAYVFDSNIGTITANATGGTSNTITLHADAATQNSAYFGVKLRIVDRKSNTAQTEVHVIQNYNAITKVATIDGTWTYAVPDADTIFSLDFEFKDAESFVVSNGTNHITTSMNISNDSKYSILTDDYQGAYISEKNFESLLFPLPNYAIKEDSITDNEYFGRKVYTGTFSGLGVLQGPTGFSTGSGITSAVTGTPISAADAIDNFFVVLTSSGTTLTTGNIVNFLNPVNRVSVTTAANSSTVTMTVPGANNATATVYMKVKVPYPEEASLTDSYRKVKQRRTANTQIVTTTGADTIVTGNVFLYNQETNQPGLQLNISKDYIESLKDPAQSQSLYVADVLQITGVYDFGTRTANTQNLPFATDLTASYSLESNQTDNTYEHSYIRLKSGRPYPTGNVVVFADYYSHSGTGYFSVDSYIEGGTEYKDIPSYTSVSTGQVYYLRDLIDFRPRRKDGSAGVAGAYDESIIGQSGSNFETNFAYYLPRIDKLIVTKDRKFEVIQGVPSLTPKPPPNRNDAMTIYTLILPPYVFIPEDITARYVDNRRYTMRDIGELEQRIQNLEYFSTLNFLEKAALDETFVDDSTGLSRVKTGVVVDPLKNYKTSDVANEDFTASVDLKAGEIRPGFLTDTYSLTFGTGTNYTANSTIVSMNYTSVSFISQPVASSVISINPFGIKQVVAAGSIQTTPITTLPDVTQPPVVNSNPDGVNDLWANCSRYNIDTFTNRKEWEDFVKKSKEYKAFIKGEDVTFTDASGRTVFKTKKELARQAYRCYRGEWKWWERRSARQKTVGTNTDDDDRSEVSRNVVSNSPTVASTSTVTQTNRTPIRTTGWFVLDQALNYLSRR